MDTFCTGLNIGLIVGCVGSCFFSNIKYVAIAYNSVKTLPCSLFVKAYLGLCSLYKIVLNSNDSLIGVSYRLSNEWTICRSISASNGAVYTHFIRTTNNKRLIDRNRYYAYVREESPLYNFFGDIRIDLTPLPGVPFPPLERKSGLMFYEVITPDGTKTFINPYNKPEEENVEEDNDEPCE